MKKIKHILPKRTKRIASKNIAEKKIVLMVSGATHSVEDVTERKG